MTRAFLRDLRNCELTLPTSVVSLHMDSATKRVSLAGTESLTQLFANMTDTATPCPKLQSLGWRGNVLSERRILFPVGDLTTLSEMNVVVDAIKPGFRFPTQLTPLRLQVREESVDVTFLTQLTRLQSMEIRNDKDPLDLSGLMTLTSLDSNRSPISRLPTSLSSATSLRSPMPTSWTSRGSRR